MSTIKDKSPVRHELLAASEEFITDAVLYAEPMVLRGLLYQLTGDPELAAIEVNVAMRGFFETIVPAREEDVTLIRRKAVDFLKAYRDAGAGRISHGPDDRLPTSLSYLFGESIPEAQLGLYLEELALDPWARSLRWQAKPEPERLRDFNVTIIGAGMGGLNAAVQLKRAGIPYTVIEKNSGVGGTWFENRYPGARVDTPSRAYTHIYGVDYGYLNSFCGWKDNFEYFNWVADNFDVRRDVQFNTEVISLTWDEFDAMWEIRTVGPDGERITRSNAVFTAVGFLNRPNMPKFEGAKEFQGQSWHTARWPSGIDLRGKRVAVIGTGCTGYQMIPELALEAEHVTVFQRTPQWCFPQAGYRSPFPPQIPWLDRNLPFYTNFMRVRLCYTDFFARLTTVDPNFDDPHACNPMNKGARDSCIAFLETEIRDPELRAAMTSEHPVWSARAVIVDPEYSILDAVQRDNVTLVTSGIKRLNRSGIESTDGMQYDVDIIVYATGFQASEYLAPMAVTGRGGKTLDELWAKDGARAYLGAMMPGFPNLWAIYGPNTNGALFPVALDELVARYAMQCIERLILDDKKTVDVKEDAYWKHARYVDERNHQKVWSDPRAHNYYWTKHGRSATQSPFTSRESWSYLERPDFSDLNLG